MNVICSTIEATTATTQTIGTCIGLLSIIWSHASGLLHCAEGTIMNPIISTICGPIIGGGGGGLCGTLIGGGGGALAGGALSSTFDNMCLAAVELVSIVGGWIPQGLGCGVNMITGLISMICPK